MALSTRPFADALLRHFVSLLALLGPAGRWRVCRCLAPLVLLLAHSTRRRLIQHLHLAFPAMGRSARTRLALRSYARVCMGVLDSLFLKELRVDIAYEDAGARQALTQGERACVSTLHMGCYETVALALQRLTGRCTTLAKLPPGLPSIATRLRASGIRYLDRTEGNQLFELVAALRKGGFVCLHADHQGRDIEVRFLGQTTKAPVGCALVAALGGAPLLLGHAQMLAAGHYRVSFSTLSTQAPGRDLASLKRQVRRCYRRFDALVRAHPEHYYWSYARFRPRAEPQAGPPQSKPAAFSQEPVRSWRGAL